MRSIKLLFTVLSLVVLTTACENYSDTPIDYSPIFPISGEWRIRITEIGPDTLLKTAAGGIAMYTFGTYNTSDNQADSMWIRNTTAMVSDLGTLRGKIGCDVPNLSFSGANATDISFTTGVATFTVTEGKVILNAITMPSGIKADMISFRLTSTKTGNRNFLFEGYRRTLWNEDETFTTF